MPKEYLDDDLYSAVQYAQNDDKTDKQMFVAGINCSKQNAYAEMVSVQKRFGMKGKVVAYHGIQSFKPGEVTPEEAFEIGKETARRMWGCGSPVETSDCNSNQKHRPSRQARPKYQVLVALHANTDNLHCHFIVNPCSFKDGQKFQNKIGDHIELRKVSDEVCREYGKSVLSNSNFYSKGKKKEYWVRKNGKMTHRDMLKRDIEYCLNVSYNRDSFYKQLFSLGYTVDYSRMSVRAKGWERSIRLNRLGYTPEVIDSRLSHNLHQPGFLYTVWNTHLPKKNKSVLLSAIAHELGFNIEHSHDIAEIYIDLLFLIIINAFQFMKEVKDAVVMSVDLRHQVKDLQQFIYDYRFLREMELHTLPQLDRYIEGTKTQIQELERERALLRNKIRRETDPKILADNKAQRSAITNQHIAPLRKTLKQAQKIREKSPHLYEMLKAEWQMEAPYRRFDRDGHVVFKNSSEHGVR